MEPFVPDLTSVLCPTTPGGWLGEAGCLLAEQGTAALVPAGLAAVLALALLGSGVRWLLRRDLQGKEAFLYPDAPPVRPHRSPRSGPSGHSTASAAPEPGPSSPPVPVPEPGEGAEDAGKAAPRPKESVTTPEQSVTEPTAPAGTVEPPEGTLQLLPGRIEVTSPDGTDGPREVRFVRVPGAPPEVTFGRTDGPAHRHVRLPSPTVSRRQATMRFDGTQWRILNHSSTNPTRVNGRMLDSAEGAAGAPLRDGDRVEMGEVILAFHQERAADRLPLRSSWYTDRGRRTGNEDAVAVRTLSDGREIAVVCDGMGGHAAGRAASHTALETFVARLEEGADLDDSVREANRAVRSAAEADPALEGMGTTLVALLRDGASYRIANVGDSRAYRIDAEGIEPITRDHSFVAEVVQDGRMSEEEALRSPWRNAVTRHLGGDDDVEVDLFGPYPANEDHLVLLCSDGLHGVVPSADLASLLRRTESVRDMARDAGEEALQRGGDDNVTVAVVAFGAGIAAAPVGEAD